MARAPNTPLTSFATLKNDRSALLPLAYRLRVTEDVCEQREESFAFQSTLVCLWVLIGLRCCLVSGPTERHTLCKWLHKSTCFCPGSPRSSDSLCGPAGWSRSKG